MIYLALYVLIGIIWYGVDFAAWQESYPLVKEEFKDRDRRDAMIMGVLWPFAMMVTTICVILKLGKLRFHGIRFK